MFIVRSSGGDQAPLGAACQPHAIGSDHVPLLTELEDSMVVLHSYRHAAPNGASAPSPGCGTSGRLALLALVALAIWLGAGSLAAYGPGAPDSPPVARTPKTIPPPPSLYSNETISVILVTGATFADRSPVQNETVAIRFGPGFAAPAGYSPLAGLPATLVWSQVKPLLARGEIVLVDARDHVAFRVGHIPGAASLPLNSSPQAIAEFTAKVPLSTPLVIYCASADCPVSSDLARVLKDYGFRDVREMPGGFTEWLMAETASQTPATLSSGHEQKD